MERDRRGYPYRTDNIHKGRGVKKTFKDLEMCPQGWREWCDAIVGLRALIIGDINKVMKKKKNSVDR